MTMMTFKWIKKISQIIKLITNKQLRCQQLNQQIFLVESFVVVFYISLCAFLHSSSFFCSVSCREVILMVYRFKMFWNCEIISWHCCFRPSLGWKKKPKKTICFLSAVAIPLPRPNADKSIRLSGTQRLGFSYWVHRLLAGRRGCCGNFCCVCRRQHISVKSKQLPYLSHITVPPPSRPPSTNPHDLWPTSHHF